MITTCKGSPTSETSLRKDLAFITGGSLWFRKLFRVIAVVVPVVPTIESIRKGNFSGDPILIHITEMFVL
jgi:hypothetical protein